MIIIVLTLGSSAHDLGLAIVSALVAVVLVSLVGIIVSRQLSGVPENAMKLVVGVMLVSFGTFWGGKGLGLKWPGSDLMIPVLVLAYGVVTYVLVQALSGLASAKAAAHIDTTTKTSPVRKREPARDVELVAPRHRKGLPVRLIEGFLRFWWEFFIGDTPELFIGTLVILGVVELLLNSKASGISDVIVAPVLVILLLNATVVRAYRSKV